MGTVGQRQEDVAHVLAQFGDEAQALTEEEALRERRRDVAFVAKEASKEPKNETGNELAVVGVAKSEAEGKQLATVVDDQMEFEAVEPSDRGLAAASADGKDPMLLDPRRMTDSERGGGRGENSPQDGPL